MPDSNKPFSRRTFLGATTCAGAAWALSRIGTLPAVAAGVPQDSRVSQTPLVDKGFASVTRIGNGVYATISDPGKGFETICNGGFLVGRDSALCIEGFASPAGASFQMDALRLVTKVPVQAAVDTHYHFDHTMGNSFYGGLGIPLWAQFRTAMRMGQVFGMIQNQPAGTFLGEFQQKGKEAKSDLERQRAQGDLAAATGMRDAICASLVAFPNHAVTGGDSGGKMFDLGGLSAAVEMHNGHSGTDVIVRIPDQHIVFTGDLLFSSWYPETYDAAFPLWRATLATFAGYEKDTIFVPGHGSICGQEGVALARAVIDDLTEQADKFFDAGATVDEATDRYVVPERFKSFQIYSWAFTISAAMSRLYFDWQVDKQRSAHPPAAPKSPAANPHSPAAPPAAPKP
jgi:glyoxylase-like metal-dependent hydrolase (beta-lactamase superfamily II)